MNNLCVCVCVCEKVAGAAEVMEVGGNLSYHLPQHDAVGKYSHKKLTLAWQEIARTTEWISEFFFLSTLIKFFFLDFKSTVFGVCLPRKICI